MNKNILIIGNATICKAYAEIIINKLPIISYLKVRHNMTNKVRKQITSDTKTIYIADMINENYIDMLSCRDREHQYIITTSIAIEKILRMNEHLKSSWLIYDLNIPNSGVFLDKENLVKTIAKFY
jgi:hypothetical protein